jgi:hypothetical protein
LPGRTPRQLQPENQQLVKKQDIALLKADNFQLTDIHILQKADSWQLEYQAVRIGEVYKEFEKEPLDGPALH